MRVDRVVANHVAFNLSLEELDLELLTRQYRFPLMDFIIPNYINILSKYFFYYLKQNYPFGFRVQCQLSGGFHELWNVLK